MSLFVEFLVSKLEICHSFLYCCIWVVGRCGYVVQSLNYVVSLAGRFSDVPPGGSSHSVDTGYPFNNWTVSLTHDSVPHIPSARCIPISSVSGRDITHYANIICFAALYVCCFDFH